jgi:hypothetical protein
MLDLWPAVSSKQDSDGKIRVRIPHYQLDCDNTEEMRKYFSVEFVTWDDFRAKKPYTNSPILSTTCEDFVGPAEDHGDRRAHANRLPDSRARSGHPARQGRARSPRDQEATSRFCRITMGW